MNATSRYFDVRENRDCPTVHLCDSEARRGGITLCGLRWHYREPVLDPYANPYAQAMAANPCRHCAAIANATEKEPRA